MPKKTADTYAREEGARIAQALFGLVGKVRLYNTDARAHATRLIRDALRAEATDAEGPFYEAALTLIQKIDEAQRAAHVAAYEAREPANHPLYGPNQGDVK